MKIKTLAVLFLLAATATAQHSARTTLLERKKFNAEVGQKVNNANLNEPLQVKHFLWAVPAFNLAGDSVNVKLAQLVDRYSSLSERQRYDLVMCITDRNLSGKEALLQRMLTQEKLAKTRLAIIAALNQPELVGTDLLADSTWQEVALAVRDGVSRDELTGREATLQVAHLSALFPTQQHVVVLARANRNVPAKVYVIEDGGVRNGNPLFFLARSATNALPYFTNGNTPAGIFKVERIDSSDNVFIGPVKTLVTSLPFESDVNVWGVPGVPERWSEASYEQLLHPSLAKRKMLWQAYRAGKLGRAEIIMHGSTINPSYFEDTEFFPLTPSLGCLSAFELWNPVNGTLLESHQQRLLEHISSSKGKLGFLVVLQVDEDAYNKGL